MDYFDKQLEALKTEWAEDREAFRLLTESTQVTDRRANGTTWYPVAIRGTETGLGDYITLEIERTTHHDLPHQMRAGMPAVLFSNHDPKNRRLEGTLSFQSENRLKIRLLSDELPAWTREGKLGIDLMFDENSYEEMQHALKTAAALQHHPEEGRLIRVLTGREQPQLPVPGPPCPEHSLNISQQSALCEVLYAPDLAIVHGPPGTGKTTTLVRAIIALLKKEKERILVAAPSNTAVDLLTERLAEQQVNVLRIGNPVRVSEQLLQHTLDHKITRHSGAGEIRHLRKRAAEFKNMAHKYKRNFGKEEREQRRALFDEANRITREIDLIESYVTEDILNGTEVITATLVGAGHHSVRHLRYRTVVIDEAGQSLEPACWIAILKAQKVVLAGDHLQLPPTIKSTSGLVRQELGVTLLEKCAARYPGSVTLLEEQYRMNEAIMGFSSAQFYGNKLKANREAAGRVLFPGDLPLELMDTAGCGFDERQDGTSIANPEEAALLFKHLAQLLSTPSLRKAFSTDGSSPDIAVISPYRQQIAVLKELLAHHPFLSAYRDFISINTIDGFQGQERDVVYISLTRSNSGADIGFLADTRRMNVAMTRARKKLVVIGDSATLSSHPFYLDFIAYAGAIDAHRSAWELSE